MNEKRETTHAEMIDCPRGCGWPGAPECDEAGLPYTCFYCYNRGEVPASWSKGGAGPVT